MTARLPYVLTEAAKQELRHEIAWSARRWGRSHANAYHQGLRRMLLRICEQALA